MRKRGAASSSFVYRKSIFLVLAMGVLGFGVSVLGEVPSASGEPAAGRPNIVVIMTDDLDVHSLQVALDLGLMPFLQQHVVEGSLQFRQAFVTNSLCCPSRATFLTGQYSHNNGVLSNSGPYGGVRRLKDDSTLATWLHDAGYRTGHVGKYLNGYGIDLTTGVVSGVPQHDPTYIPPGWDDWQALVDTTTYRVYGYTLNDNGQLVEPAAYQTDELASRAVDFIREGEASDETPFFLAVMPLAPHVEVDGKTSFDQWRDLWKWTIRPPPRHAGSVYLRLAGAGPSVPVDAIALNTDLAPTIAHLAGVVPGLPVDGRSLLALAGGNPPPGWRKRFLVEHWWTDSLFEIPSFAALRTGSADAVAPETLYVEYYDQNYPQMADGEPEPVVFRELYDLRQDPYQLQSLHSDPIRAGQVAALASVLTELRRCGSAAGGARSPLQCRLGNNISVSASVQHFSHLYRVASSASLFRQWVSIP